MIDLPDELSRCLTGYGTERIGHGESGADVWRCTLTGEGTFYLKVADVGTDLRLDQEAERLRWMKDHGLLVPAVIAYQRVSSIDYLLIDEVPGVAASDVEWSSSPADVIAALGRGLRLLHQTSTGDCPFDQRLARQIADARARAFAGHVREDDFDKSRMGRSAADLLTELESLVPGDEDLVFTHGDFCLPNVILRRSATDDGVEIAGFIACGRSGIADRHQDLALGVRSIAYNLGEAWVSPFLLAYGLQRADPDKLYFYTLLDEFF